MPKSKQKLFDLIRSQGIPNITDETYQEWATFLFYTSWFEESLFTYKKRQSPENDMVICEKLITKININDYDYFGDYFCERYIDENNKTTDQFRNLKLSKASPINPQITTKEALINYKTQRTRNHRLLFAYLMIVYRFRNNMFHGSKGLINLVQYTEPISIINQFMNQLLEDIFTCQYTGFRTSDR